MKSIKVFSLILVIALFSATSCTKEAREEILSGISATVGFQIAGIPMELSINGGNAMYYERNAYDNFMYAPNYAVSSGCYIKSRPGNSESIGVFDRNDVQIGTVRCWQGTSAPFNQVYNSILKWFDTHPNAGWCAVNVDWEPKPYTRGGLWSGTIN